MKKITLLAAAFVAISFASCKKDYTCSCSYVGGSSVTKIEGTSKKGAQAHCVSGTTTGSTSGSIGYVETCTLSK